jgi:hypothetical protein
VHLECQTLLRCALGLLDPWCGEGEVALWGRKALQGQGCLRGLIAGFCGARLTCVRGGAWEGGAGEGTALNAKAACVCLCVHVCVRVCVRVRVRMCVCAFALGVVCVGASLGVWGGGEVEL